jgi:5-methylthioadenosine/S-adenosylhomocysteine deaminase
VSDRFDAAYTEGVLDELPEEAGGRDFVPRAVPRAAFALRGCVLTPDEQLDPGFVVVEDGTIADVRAGAPGPGVDVVETEGVILPGLIDLHGHPEYNVFAAWEPPKQFANRYRWRDSTIYERVVKEPWHSLTDPPNSLQAQLVRYAEARALVAGVTAIQGASYTYTGRDEALVRNVDLRIFGRHRARSVIDLDATRPDKIERLRSQLAANEIDALYVHLAEGQASDERSQREFSKLTDAGLLAGQTVIIHGTALSRTQLGDVRDAGAKLVWSPQSNLRLYGETTRAADALELGIPLALGADWLPSGSPSLLAEIKIARRVLAQQGRAIEARQLVTMVTAGAAAIAGFGDRLGRLETGRPADVLVLERHHQDPWENVAHADPSWVELVTVGGSPCSARTSRTCTAGGR